ncbi:baseplate assembly protein [Hartmannibacter diazotrophicus]|uniref:Baseplate assembly protein n=1 Tax=Hartmannibacter diazotrophicus TaxID=1482074 RepID=A0A2C9D5B4_9HYPH|nr:baseplate J/gp47 family protein [Hartmannibacter diazotrophicus]SON55532.1 baseplate assembly protein [Hartmannibacter diazotrophicus]
MTRFVAPDLSALGGLPLTETGFAALEASRSAYLKAALALYGIDYDVEALETDPLRIAFSEGGAYQEQLVDQRINEAMSALSLATATGAALDHIAATYYGISRQSTTDGDGLVTFESDARFRARIALAPEAFSTAGPEGAYDFHALELDGLPDLSDVATYSEEDGATYSDAVLFADAYSRGQRTTAFAGRANGDPVLAPEVLLVVLPGTDYGAADQALIDRVYDAVTSEEVRPIGDNVRIEAAEVVDYTVEMTVAYAAGADPAPMIAEVEAKIAAYAAKRRRVGFTAERLGLGGCGYVSGVEAVTLTSPAADVGGGSKQAPNCTAITVTAVQAAGTWA